MTTVRTRGQDDEAGFPGEDRGGESITAGEARSIARQWVGEHLGSLPGFLGAYLAGSINDLPDHVPLPATSDVDVMVVLDAPDPPTKPGKMRYRDVLLEITYLSTTEVATPERVLGHYHLANSLRTPGILADPSGRLTSLQREVGAHFADRSWVLRRCEQARDTVIERIESIDPAAPFHRQVMSWLFAAGGVPHVLLVAGLRNPTVRRRYETARESLAAYGHEALYPALLDQIGCRDMTPERVSHHVDVLEGAFDEAADAVRTPFPFASDISSPARPIAIDGSREMIACGSHREAIFWIGATFTRCMFIFDADAPEVLPRWDGAYRHLLADLGIRSSDDLLRGGTAIRESLPRVWNVAMAIIAATPEIVDE